MATVGKDVPSHTDIHCNHPSALNHWVLPPFSSNDICSLQLPREAFSKKTVSNQKRLFYAEAHLNYLLIKLLMVPAWVGWGLKLLVAHFNLILFLLMQFCSIVIAVSIEIANNCWLQIR